MSDNIDRHYYLHLFSMYIDLGTETLLNLFLHYINKSAYHDVQAFLRSQCIKETLIDLKKRKILDEHEFIKINDWDRRLNDIDITLLVKLLTHLFGDQIQHYDKEPGPTDQTIGADIYRMRKFRNKLFHVSKAKLCHNDFETKWKKIKDTMLRVAKKIGDAEKEKMEGRIAEYRGNPVDALAKERIDRMLEEYLNTKEKANELCKQMNRYELLFQSTPKNYIRYLKLLFECGKRVLLAILSRECDRRKQTLRDILGKNKERLQREITNDNDVNQLFPKSSTYPAHDRWSLSLLATVILTTFTELDLEEKSKIEHLKNAADETQNAAKLLLETDYLFEQSTRLTCSITLLAAGINEETKLFCIRYIDQYPNMEIQDDVTIEKYLKEINIQGEKIKELDEVHRDLISELRDDLTETEGSSLDFEEPREIQIRIYTICEDKNTEKLVEENIEEAYQITQITGSPASLYGVKKELDKLVQRLSSYTDVHVTAMKRNCITLTLSSSSCKGMLQLLNNIESNLQKSCDRLSDEFSFMYNEVVVLWGHITFESIFYALGNKHSQEEGDINKEEGTNTIEEPSDMNLDILEIEEMDFDEEEPDVVKARIVVLKSEQNVVDVKVVQKDLLSLSERINKMNEDIDSAKAELDNEYKSLLEVPDKNHVRQNSEEIRQVKDKDDKELKTYQTELFCDIVKMNMTISTLLRKVVQKLEKIVTSFKDILSAWKKVARYFYFRLEEEKAISNLAGRCSSIGLILYDLQHDIIPFLFNIHVDCGWDTHKLQDAEKKIEDISDELLKSTFVITGQSDCFIRVGQLPIFDVRILSGESLPEARFVEAILVPESEIENLIEREDEMQKLIQEKENCIKLSSNLMYLTRHQRTATFKLLKLLNTNDLDPSVVLYRVIFSTNLGKRRFWTLSLPIAVLNDSSAEKEILPFISIVRVLLHTESKSPALKMQDRVSLGEITEMLQLKFMQLYFKNPRILSEENMQYLEECLFGKSDVSETPNMTDDIQVGPEMHRFWFWIHEICQLINRYLLDFWKDWLIIGFISKAEAKRRLIDVERASSGTFILSFSEPDFQNGEHVHGHLKAFVLRILQVKHVHVTNLEASKFRKLGKFLDEKINDEHSSLWEILIRKCGKEISHSIKTKIENAVEQGISFLEEFGNHFKLSDLEESLEECGMHQGLDILFADVEHESVLSLPVGTLREIGLVLQDSLQSPKDGEMMPCWQYISITISTRSDKGHFSKNDQMNISKSSSPGEKFLEVFDNCGLKMDYLKRICSNLKIHRILNILKSNIHGDYLEKTIVDIDIGGEKEFQEKSLVEILKEKANAKGDNMLKYIFPGYKTLQQLEEIYAKPC